MTRGDRASLAKFRADTGASYPILTGMSADTQTAYGVESWPSVRVLGADGRVVGRDMTALAKALGEG